MRLNSSRSLKERGNDDYFTPLEAVLPLLSLETLPDIIHEPACGDGAIALPLRHGGCVVTTSDIVDYGLPGTRIADYLRDVSCADWAGGIVTNPPYKLAMEFAHKAVREVPYVALLLRLNWLETPKRAAFFRRSSLSRIWVSSRRLPMMHKRGWEGPKAVSNCAYSWFVFDRRDPSDDYRDPIVRFFDWKDFVSKKGVN